MDKAQTPVIFEEKCMQHWTKVGERSRNMVAKLNNLPREAHFRTLEYDDSTQIALYSKISYKVALDKPLFNRDSNLQFLRNHYDSTTSHFNARKQFCTSPVLQHPSKSLDPKTQITPSLTQHFHRRSFSRIWLQKGFRNFEIRFSRLDKLIHW